VRLSAPKCGTFVYDSSARRPFPAFQLPFPSQTQFVSRAPTFHFSFFLEVRDFFLAELYVSHALFSLVLGNLLCRRFERSFLNDPFPGVACLLSVYEANRPTQCSFLFYAFLSYDCVLTAFFKDQFRMASFPPAIWIPHPGTALAFFKGSRAFPPILPRNRTLSVRPLARAAPVAQRSFCLSP